MAAKTEIPLDALGGKFFHTYKGEVLECQRQILSRLGEGLYLVRTYDWLVGAEYEQHIEPSANMTAWKFPDCHEDMHLAYSRYTAQQERREAQ
jgi:hypothetical protein